MKAKISKESLENTETSDSLKQEQVKETMENKMNEKKKKNTQNKESETMYLCLLTADRELPEKLRSIEMPRKDSAA